MAQAEEWYGIVCYGEKCACLECVSGCVCVLFCMLVSDCSRGQWWPVLLYPGSWHRPQWCLAEAPGPPHRGCWEAGSSSSLTQDGGDYLATVLLTLGSKYRNTVSPGEGPPGGRFMVKACGHHSFNSAVKKDADDAALYIHTAVNSHRCHSPRLRWLEFCAPGESFIPSFSHAHSITASKKEEKKFFFLICQSDVLILSVLRSCFLCLAWGTFLLQLLCISPLQLQNTSQSKWQYANVHALRTYLWRGVHFYCRPHTNLQTLMVRICSGAVLKALIVNDISNK